ncbi:DUF4225 domain-containing protein [Enterobacter hormaechei]|uniref:DUF4225 domain-containing protein n=1 Tax=Enterobacter hormaechei TaxID=158836 RepID=UPI00292EA856|nr:DUF4225 domain-containing protein [Enterobacter hormaechei]
MQRNQNEIDEFTALSRKIRKTSYELGNYYIYNCDVRNAFVLEEEDFLRNIEKEVGQYCLSYAAGIRLMKEEIENLNRQKAELDMNKVKLYMIVEREKEKNSITTITLKRVGFVGGAVQIFAGSGVCVGSLGLACGGFGVPLMAHGSENMYENGYYLLYREDVSGYTKDAYRYIAHTLGYSNDDADVVYNVADLGLSGFGLWRQVLKPDTWKLYRYIGSDYIHGWKLMISTELATEAAIDATTISSIYKIKEDH